MADIKSINGNPIVPESVADGAVGVDGLAEDVVELLDNKADIDGYYSQLTAGLAENLIGRGDAVPAEYLYRTAGGTADIEDGIATIDCIKGNTVVWEQLAPALTESNYSAYQFSDVSFSDGVFTGTIDSTTTTLYHNVAYTAGHRYALFADVKAPANVSVSLAFVYAGSIVSSKTVVGVDKFERNVLWYKPTNGPSGSNDRIVLRNFVADNVAKTISIKNIQLFDLTLMFGAGNEPSTVEEFVEEFEAMFPLSYYPYSAPKLLPVDMRGIETVGFNQWDEEWETGRFDTTTGANVASTTQIRSKNLIPVFPSTEYNVQTPNGIWLMFLDANKQVITSGIPEVGGGSGNSRCLGGEITAHTFTTPANCHYVKWYGQNAYGPTYNHDICLNLSWSGYRNGEYEKHWSAERPIDTSSFFPTGMKKVGAVYDELTADSAVTRVGVVDMGTLEWKKHNSSGDVGYYFAVDIVGIARGVAYLQPSNLECARYTTIAADWDNHIGDKQICKGIGATDVVAVKDSAYTTAADFKAAMSSVMLYYELATPTTTEIDPPLNLSYKVSDFGTERIMVDETADAPQTAPVSMEVEYGINAIDTIRRLPKEYQSHKSMGQLTAALESSLGIDITETWDENDQRYEYQVSGLEVDTDEIADGSVTAAKLASNAVTTTTVQDGSITGVKIADDTIPDAKLVQTGGVLEHLSDLEDTLFNISRESLELSAFVDGYLVNIDGSVAANASCKYASFEVTSDYVGQEFYVSGTSWYSVKPYVFVGATSTVYADTPAATSVTQITDFPFAPTETGTLYINKYDSGSIHQIGAVFYDKIVSIKSNLLPQPLPVTDIFTYEDVTLTLLGGKLLNGSTGVITDNSNQDYVVTDYAEVTPSSRVMVSTRHFYSNGLYAFYDSAKNFVSGFSAAGGSTVTSLNCKIVSVPSNAAYIVLGFLRQANTFPSCYLRQGVVQDALPSQMWSGYKWTCVGDSLTAYNTTTSTHYFDYVAGATGIEVNAMGVSGSGYAHGGSYNFMTRISDVPTDSDVVTIFGSGNDGSAGLPLGTAADTGTETLGGVINTTIDNLYAIMPVVNLGIVTPTPWQGNMPYNNGFMENYSNLIVEICKRRGIPCLDLFHCSNLNPNSAEVRALVYSKDNGGGTHPDELGHKLIAPRFKAFLETLLI